MDNINELLNSISPQDLEKLKNVASSLMNNSSGSDSNQQQQTNTASPTPNADISSLVGGDMTNMLVKVASQMNKEDDRTKFINALRPLLSEERRKKADEAAKFLKLMDTLPLLKGLF